MIVITRQSSPSHNKEIDDETVKKDVSSLLPNFIPTSGNQQIVIFAPPQEEAECNTVASGELASGDSYIIQDFPLEERRFVRRLSFTSNLKAVQSEVLFHVTGKKKKKVFETTTLCFSIHRCMASALLACPPLSPSPRIVVLGLGGGCLPSFFASFFPEAAITAVDVDKSVVRIARDFFRLPETVETVVMDGAEYVAKLKEEGKGVDYLFVDIDSKDLAENASFPPMQFLSVGNGRVRDG